MIPIIIETIRPTKPNPAPSAIINFPVFTLFVPINNPPIITAIPPSDAMNINITNIYRILNFDTFELSSKKSIKIDVKKFSMKVL